MNISDLTDEMISKYFFMLTEARQKKIAALSDVKQRKIIFCSEILARKCLSELCDSPEFSFNLLCNPNGKSIVGNFNCEISIVNFGDIVACAVSHDYIGIGINGILPFSFLDAQNNFSDSEIRIIFAESHCSFSEIVKLNRCDETSVKQKYSLFLSLKDAYYYSGSREIRTDNKNICFSFDGVNLYCADKNADIKTAYIDNKHNISVAVIERKKI